MQPIFAKRAIAFVDARRMFVHRFTMEYVPSWAMQPMGNGRYPAPQYRTDLEWYENTLFTADRRCKRCESSNQSFPLGESLESAYVPARKYEYVMDK